MTLLAPTLLAIGLAAGAPEPKPLAELPKAPVEFTVPVEVKVPSKAGSPAKPPPALPARPAPAPAAKPAPRAAVPHATPAPAPVVPVAPPTAVASTSAAPAPASLGPGYELVEQKCSRCHGMEKALNATFSPDDWDGYLKKKLRRAGAGITPEQAVEIETFLKGWAARRGVAGAKSR